MGSSVNHFISSYEPIFETIGNIFHYSSFWATLRRLHFHSISGSSSLNNWMEQIKDSDNPIR